MRHRHLRQREHHRDRDEARDGVADQHRRAGIADGDGAAHEQAGADGAAQPDHHDLALGQPLVQPAFAFDDRFPAHAGELRP